MAMSIKSHLPFFAFSLFVLGACNPEKPPVTQEVQESTETALPDTKLTAGKTVYEANCAGCHDASVAGAPKPGDKPAWTTRIATGMDVMVKKSIDGFEGKAGAMPPKGGNAMLTDEEVTNAVMYMVSQST